MNGGALGIDDLILPIPGIIEMFYPGFYGGTEIARTIFGEINRFGKMPFT